MRVSRAKFAESRERIPRTRRQQLFREKGYDGIGVADIMKAAGLTHGGFYRAISAPRATLEAQVVGVLLAEAAAE